MENNWLWVADHDIDDFSSTQVSLFVARGLLIEGSRIWLVGSAVEHHTLYQYQLVKATDVWMGQIQTETPYYQPNPPAPYPFTQLDATLQDPDFTADCQITGSDSNKSLGSLGNPPCAMAWGLRILDSRNVVIFGAGLYSFFNNYDTSCSTAKSGENCQARIFWVGPGEGGVANASAAVNGTAVGLDTLAVEVYNLNTIGSVSMVTRQGDDVATWDQNVATFASTLAAFRCQPWA